MLIPITLGLALAFSRLEFALMPELLGPLRVIPWVIAVWLVQDQARRLWSYWDAVRERDRHRLAEFADGRVRTRISAICAALIVSLTVVAWPATIRVALSTPSLQIAAARYLAGGADDHQAQWIGLFKVQEVFGPSRGFVFFQTGNGSGRRIGILYDPDDKVLRKARFVMPGWYLDVWDGSSERYASNW